MKSYLKFLSRNKLYTAIEAVGLIVSFAFLIIIGSSIRDQRAVVKGVPGHENLYLVSPRDRTDLCDFRLVEGLSAFPQIEKAAAMYTTSFPIIIGGNVHYLKLLVMYPELMEMIPMDIVSCNGKPLAGTEDILLTESAARRFFQEDNPVGKTIRYSQGEGGQEAEIEITGIVKDPAWSIYGDFDIVVSVESRKNPVASAIRQIQPQVGRGIPILVFAQMVPGADTAGLDAAIKQLPGWFRSAKQLGDAPILTPFDDLYFSETPISELRQGNALYLHVLIALGILLFLSALLSFINLSLAISGGRAKEMASRRLLGESRTQVFGRMMLEILLFTLVCFLLAIPLAYAIVPGLDGLRPNGLNIPFRVCASPSFWLIATFGVVLAGLAAGAAPAALCASFKPLDVVSGQTRRQQKMTFNRVCIIFQSALALILITMSITLERQLHYMETADIGVDMAEDLYLFSQGQDVLADALQGSPLVREIGYTSEYPTRVSRGVYRWTYAPEYLISCDSTAFRLLGFRVQEQFCPIVGTVLLCRSTANEWGVSREHPDPGDHFDRRHDDRIISGIIEDYRTVPVNKMPEAAGDMMVQVKVISPNENRYIGMLIQTTKDHKAFEKWFEATAREVYQERSTMHVDVFENPYLKAGYLEDFMKEDHKDLRQYLRLVELFCLISILLAALGLVGMSSFFASAQSKGIAIRKVFGGTVGSETRRNVILYLWGILIAVAIGVPVGVLAVQRLLQGWPEHFSGSWWIFVMAVLLLFVVSFASVLWQTLKAAKTDPAVELKKE